MSEEKFTPGFWHRAFNKSRSGKGSIRGLSHCRIENTDGVVIAFAVPQKSSQEQIANTDLCAAAPKMYSVLKLARHEFEAVAEWCDENGMPDDARGYRNLANGILDVLKQARGIK